MSEPVYRPYRRTQIAELTPWEPDSDMDGVSISEADRRAGSPKPGDMIARNPVYHADRWLVSAAYFAANFEAIEESKARNQDESEVLDVLRKSDGAVV